MTIAFKTFVPVILIVLALIPAHAQINSLTFGPEPKGGISKLVLEYYKIDFTKEQKTALKDIEIEIIYSVDEYGQPATEKISGVSDPVLLDSLNSITRKLPFFTPRTVNGIKEPSLYLIKFQLPAYSNTTASVFQHPLWFKQYKYEDFEYIHTSGQRLDFLIGGVANTFMGKSQEYLHAGGGMKMDLLFTGKSGTGGGLVMSFYGNKLKQPYPIPSDRKQNNAPPILLIGLALNTDIAKKEKSLFNVQFELNYACQNITPRLDENDKDWVQLRGFSPGIVGNYILQLGKRSMSHNYDGTPALMAHNLNLHGAIRPIFLDLKAATGIMLELGLSYRMSFHAVDEYRLKSGL